MKNISLLRNGNTVLFLIVSKHHSCFSKQTVIFLNLRVQIPVPCTYRLTLFWKNDAIGVTELWTAISTSENVWVLSFGNFILTFLHPFWLSGHQLSHLWFPVCQPLTASKAKLSHIRLCDFVLRFRNISYESM